MTNPLTDMKTPEVKFNKNGYEIRADILAHAKEHVTGEFNAKFAGWQVSAQKDEKTGQLVTSVGMPDYPGVEKILEAAEKMYAFVNSGAQRK